ncbi:epoxide hydrolase [Clavibacter sp. MX14-G9D]|uniref:epoxide hydrolase family protein n=1 Tax=Clavibacter sp. MX14-G9D TaxID=3064656 RepID=UPI00293F3F4B|nr:epoxide hydrolase [Clavibacter sp. MX14-G9D]
MPPSPGIHPFTITASENDLADLRRRLLATRWPEAETVDDTSQGAQLQMLRPLTEHWASGYDWRRTEALLNGWGQFTTEIDGLQIHFVHVRSKAPGARALLLTHGWPGSVLEFRHAIDPLTNPEAHGGTTADAFDVIIPSVPGFGFSGHPTEGEWAIERIARAWGELMRRLGYERWFAQGGDLGAFVTIELAALQAQADIGLAGIHLNETPFEVTEDEKTAATPEEQRMLDEGDTYSQSLSAYRQEMATRPQTIGYSLSDSPTGLAAWITTMMQDVAGTHDEHGHLQDVIPRDEVIDNLMLYWLPNAGTSAARIYWEATRAGWSTNGTLDAPVTIPTGVTVMPGSHSRRSRRWAARRYLDLVRFSEAARGGHFAFLEQPEILVDDVRATFRGL